MCVIMETTATGSGGFSSLFPRLFSCGGPLFWTLRVISLKDELPAILHVESANKPLTSAGQFQCCWSQHSSNPDIFQKPSAWCVGAYTMPLPGLLSQQKRYETLYSTQSRRDDLLFTNMIDPPLSFSLFMIGSRRIIYFRSFQYFVCMAKLVLYK